MDLSDLGDALGSLQVQLSANTSGVEQHGGSPVRAFANADGFRPESPSFGGGDGPQQSGVYASSQGSTRNRSGSLSPPRRRKAVELVTEQRLPPSLLAAPAALPCTTPVPTLVSNVAATLPFEHGGTLLKGSQRAAAQAWWEKTFQCEKSQAVLQDIFWWFLAHLYQPDERLQHTLFDRAADNFVELFLEVEPKRKDEFFAHYHGGLAQTVYSAFWLSYPKSRDRFRLPSFRQEMFALVTEWTTGARTWTISGGGYLSAWDSNPLIKEEEGEETHEMIKQRGIHEQYMLLFHGQEPDEPCSSAEGSPPRGGGASPSRAAGGAGAGAEVEESELSQAAVMNQEASVSMVDPSSEYIDMYSNSTLVRQFLLTHNCSVPSRKSTINFAAYYASVYESPLTESALESARISDAAIAKYMRLSKQISSDVAASKRNVASVKRELLQEKRRVLRGDTHEYSSRIVSVVAQREQLQRKLIQQKLSQKLTRGEGKKAADVERKARGKNGQSSSKVLAQDQADAAAEEDSEDWMERPMETEYPRNPAEHSARNSRGAWAVTLSGRGSVL